MSRALFTCRACGDTDWIAEDKVRYAERTGRLCGRCYAAQRATDRQAAAEAAARQNHELGLPALGGSERQIAWAETIRAEKLKQINDLIDRVMARNNALPPAVEAAISQVRAVATAAWWIDNRDVSGVDLVSGVGQGRIQLPPAHRSNL